MRYRSLGSLAFRNSKVPSSRMRSRLSSISFRLDVVTELDQKSLIDGEYHKTSSPSRKNFSGIWVNNTLQDINFDQKREFNGGEGGGREDVDGDTPLQASINQ